MLNNDYFILKFILYDDLFFWLLNCFLSSDEEYRFMTYLTRIFQTDTQNDVTNWSTNELSNLKSSIQKALNIVLTELRNKDILEIYKNMHTFSLNTTFYLRTWVFSQLAKLTENDNYTAAISKIKKQLVIYHLQLRTLDEVT